MGVESCRSRRDANRPMTIVLAVLGVAFAAFAVWLTLRIVNRRERCQWCMQDDTRTSSERWRRWKFFESLKAKGVAPIIVRSSENFSPLSDLWGQFPLSRRLMTSPGEL